MNNPVTEAQQDSIDISLLNYSKNSDISESKPHQSSGNNEVIVAHEKVIISRDKAASNTIELCYRLFRLNSIAQESNKNSFWLEHFNVINFTEYCEIRLDINSNLGSQYLMAAKTIERLKPFYMKSIFDSNEGKMIFPIIGYTRFREVSKFVPMIENIKGSAEYRKLINMIFDPSETNSCVIEKLLDTFETSMVKEGKGDLPIKRKLKKINALRSRLSKISDEVKALLPASESGTIDKIFEDLMRRVVQHESNPVRYDPARGFDEPGQGETLQGPKPVNAHIDKEVEAANLADQKLATVLQGFN